MPINFNIPPACVDPPPLPLLSTSQEAIPVPSQPPAKTVGASKDACREDNDPKVSLVIAPMIISKICPRNLSAMEWIARVEGSRDEFAAYWKIVTKNPEELKVSHILFKLVGQDTKLVTVLRSGRISPKLRRSNLYDAGG